MVIAPILATNIAIYGGSGITVSPTARAEADPGRAAARPIPRSGADRIG
jgi:hypothetical protein